MTGRQRQCVLLGVLLSLGGVGGVIRAFEGAQDRTGLALAAVVVLLLGLSCVLLPLVEWWWHLFNESNGP